LQVIHMAVHWIQLSGWSAKMHGFWQSHSDDCTGYFLPSYLTAY
jgi:hypothetical protein